MRTIKEKESLTHQDTNEPYELAVYKRLGLSSKKAKNLVAITADIPLDRIQEICDAERDGRLQILPCKNGDTVWAILGHYDRKITETKAMFVWHNGFDVKVVCEGIGELTYGKRVFLTREEAEKALKGGAE